MNKQPCIIINNQEISWSFIQYVRNKKLRGDWDQTINAFFQARNHPEIIKYIQAGFRPDKNGLKYSLMPCKEMNSGQIELMRNWWDSLYKPKPKKETNLLKHILRDEILKLLED